jgi:hypothetical protein
MMIAMLLRQTKGSFFVRAVLLGALLVGHASEAAATEVQIAAGQVTDLQGHTVASALVKAESWESEPLGMAQSDAQGRFKVALSHPVKDLTLIVERPGFQRWALAASSPGPDGSYQILLTRTIDRKYLTELTAQSEPARFQRLARDLLAPSEGTTGDTLPLDQVLPFLKALRSRLRALLPAEPGRLEKLDLTEEQDKAAALLAYLGDPRDDALVDAWAAKQNYVSRPPQPFKGPTPEAAARAWQKVHFEKEGYLTPQSIPYNTLRTQIAPSGDHGLALHTVRYAHWGYSQYLVLVRSKNVWEVRRVIDHEHWHGG